MRSIWIGELAGTSIGTLWAAADNDSLVAISFMSDQADFISYLSRLEGVRVSYDPVRVSQALQQIQEYLQGSRRQFDLELPWQVMRPFQAQVLRATQAIPYGETRTYGEIAAQIGKPGAARAVGRAQATNPLPIVIPCHRVVGSDGKLHGYSAPGGLATKAWLLALEKRVSAADHQILD